MTKKEVFRRYIIFIIGLFINSFGVCLITKASLGTSPISSIPYVLSLQFAPTLGAFTIYFSFLLIILQIILLGKKFKKSSLLQIPVSIAFGYFIDFCMYLLHWFNPENYLYRAVALMIGCVILGFGVYTEVIADVVMLPGESFVRAVTIRFDKEFGTTKVCFDASMTMIAGVISVVLFHRLNGVGVGTIVAAILVGFIAKGFGKVLKKFTALLLGTPEEEYKTAVEATQNLVITIAREFGSGGREIGKMVAEKMNLKYYDSNLLELTAEELRLPKEYIEKNDQRLTHSLLFDLYMQSNEYMDIEKERKKSVFEAETKVIREIAQKESCVIVGRLANFILKDCEHTFDVYLHAELENKIDHVMKRDGISRQEAERKIKIVEKERREHCILSTGKEWGFAKYYDLSLDTSLYGLEKTVDIIVDLCKVPTIQPN